MVNFLGFWLPTGALFGESLLPSPTRSDGRQFAVYFGRCLAFWYAWWLFRPTTFTRGNILSEKLRLETKEKAYHYYIGSWNWIRGQWKCLDLIIYRGVSLQCAGKHFYERLVNVFGQENI